MDRTNLNHLVREAKRLGLDLEISPNDKVMCVFAPYGKSFTANHLTNMTEPFGDNIEDAAAALLERIAQGVKPTPLWGKTTCSGKEKHYVFCR